MHELDKVEAYGESWRKHGIEAMRSPCGGRITRSAQAMKRNEFAPKIPSFSSVYQRLRNCVKCVPTHHPTELK